MKFFHLSDIHLGKRVNGFSMIEDQKYILKQILELADEERPDAFVLAGDIYDKSYPSPEAVAIYDEFLYQLSTRDIIVFAVSGNHDAAERVAFGSRIMNRSNIYLSPVYKGYVEPVEIEDDYGVISFYMLPFLRLADVRNYFHDAEIESYTDAVREVVEALNVDYSQRNVMITHQFVAGAKSSDSEEVVVGGTDLVNASVFDGFDYTALGHVHKPQNVGRETLRYCGTPLKYSVSEEKDIKSVTVVEMGKKGSVEVRTVPLSPLHDLRTIKGAFEELTDPAFDSGAEDDYMHVVLTDEDDIPDAIGKLRTVYPNIMAIEYDNTRTRNITSGGLSPEDKIDTKTPEELFAELYRMQNGAELSEEQAEAVEDIMEEVREDER